MATFFQITLVVTLVAVVAPEPQQFRVRTNRFFGRQEVASDNAPPAKAPYPPAGLKPDIPFDLPTETTTTQPDNTYLPPDNTYGPPTTPALESTTDVPVILLETDDDDTESVISVAVSYDNDIPTTPQQPQRIVIGQGGRGASQKLRSIRAQPILLDDGSFAYSAQLQNW